MKTVWMLLACVLCVPRVGADELQKGDVVVVTIKGAKDAAVEVDGEYTVDDAGNIRLPLLSAALPAVGMNASAFASKAEKAYVDAGIYRNPAIQVVAKKDIQAPGAVLTVGGQVKKSGEVPYRKGMTLIQAVDAAGGPDIFASRNIILIRNQKQYCLDFTRLEHKNVTVQANDSIRIEEKPALRDSWKGTDEQVKPLLGN